MVFPLLIYYPLVNKGAGITRPAAGPEIVPSSGGGGDRS